MHKTYIYISIYINQDFKILDYKIKINKIKV